MPVRAVPEINLVPRLCLGKAVELGIAESVRRMGCDIHDYVEIRKDGRWQKVGAVFRYPYFDPSKAEGPWNSPLIDHPWWRRNYSLFAVLSGVRNWDGNIVPIMDPRGIPDDLTSEVLQEYTYTVADPPDYEKNECSLAEAQQYIANGHSIWIEFGKRVSQPDWHSASWLTLMELLNYDWRGLPQDDFTHVADFLDEAIPAMASQLLPDETGKGTLFSFLTCWRQGTHEVIGVLNDWLMDQGLPTLGDCRLVFWFDN